MIITAILLFLLTAFIIGNNISILREPIRFSGILGKNISIIVLIFSVLTGFLIESSKLTRLTRYIFIRKEYIALIFSVTLFYLILANKLGISYSLTQGLVGGMLGINILFNDPINKNYLILLITIWILYPFLNLFSSATISKIIRNIKTWRKRGYIRNLGLIATFFVGYAFGANTLGTIEALSTLNKIDTILIIILASIIGVYTIGKITGEVIGGKIYGITSSTYLSTQTSTAILIETATQLSIPVPLSNLLTLGYIGPAITFQTRLIRTKEIYKIALYWILNPILTLLTTYSLAFLIQRFP